MSLIPLFHLFINWMPIQPSKSSLMSYHLHVFLNTLCLPSTCINLHSISNHCGTNITKLSAICYPVYMFYPLKNCSSEETNVRLSTGMLQCSPVDRTKPPSPPGSFLRKECGEYYGRKRVETSPAGSGSSCDLYLLIPDVYTDTSAFLSSPFMLLVSKNEPLCTL